MIGLYLLVPTLLSIFLSFLIVRAGAIALMMTGVERERANFQALSAFSRAGFTTREAEMVINNPRRRRIISWLIILGNAGLVAIIVTATSSIATSRGYQLPVAILVIILGIFVLYLLVNRTGFRRKWESFIENRLIKSRFIQDVTEELLDLTEGNGIIRVIIDKDSVFINRSLSEITMPRNEYCIVGIQRGRSWISLPESQETINKGDRLLIYGNTNEIKRTFERAGE